MLKLITVLLIICTFTETGDAMASAMSGHNGNKGLVGILIESIFKLVFMTDKQDAPYLFVYWVQTLVLAINLFVYGLLNI